ncbi:MAG: UDPGP type 1 family protein [Phycisphaerales bacterium]|nr:UDPGP type 1 family protein [Planctomycetota bacterium]MCH8507612.1 UDPGP type 1 family protein [Phycisphaerales bacterium]
MTTPTADQLAAFAHIGQEHLIRHAESLDAGARERYLAELGAFDPDELAPLIERYVRQDGSLPPPTTLEPAQVIAMDDPSREPARHTGEALIRAGKVACFTVAGGQGSRLGYDGPKGCFPTACATDKPLFQIFAEGIAGAQNRYGVTIPWYIMTSPLNHETTAAFFAQHAHFGLRPDAIRFFPQGVMPSFDKSTARMLLAEPGVLATNPDGHGGSFRALRVSGALEDMQRRGVEHLSYFQVDNPHARPVDPVFLGLHASSPNSSGQFSSKMVAKASWDEKVGVFCEADGRTQVIEYSDLPVELAKQTDDAGRLRFNAGSIAIHAISVDFIDKVSGDPDFALPFHRAVKKVPHFDPESQRHIDPAEPNAVKLERFVFDAIPMADQSIVVETDRVEEFAPVKNATGTDSIESSKRLQTERAARWLEACGVSVPRHPDGTPNAVIEISPLTAQDPEQLRETDLPTRIEPGATVVL